MKSQQSNKYQPIGDLYDLTKVDLYELHERLWYEYFTPVEDHTKEVAKFIKEQLNIVAESINTMAVSKEQEVVVVDGKTKFTPSPTDEGAVNWKGGCIYAVTKKLYEPPRKKGKVSLVVQNQDEDLMGGDDEDLLGDVKPKKGKSVAKRLGLDVKSTPAPKKSAGGKSNYDTIADLAAQGRDRDEIVELTGFARKTVTDNLWRWNQKQAALKKKK